MRALTSSNASASVRLFGWQQSFFFVVGAARPSFVEQLGILALWWLYGYAA